MRNPFLPCTILACLAAIVSTVSSSESVPPELPVATFFAEPEISQLQFSPNGRFLAALVPVAHRRNLVVMDLEKKTKLLVTKLTDEGIVEYRWANDDRLLFARDEGGQEHYGLYAVNRTGGVVDRLAYNGDQAATSRINFRFGGLIRRDRKHANKFFVLMYDSIRDRPDVALMDVRSGHYSVLVRNPGSVVEWLMDSNDVVRAGVGREGDQISVLYRDRDGEDWRTLTSFLAETRGWLPLAFDQDNRTLFVATNLEGRTVGISRYDPVTGRFLDSRVTDKTYDVISESYGTILTRSISREAIGVRYEAEKPRTVYWDPVYQRRQAALERSLPGMTVEQEDVSDDGSKIVVFASSDREPGVYFLLDKRLEQMAVTRPAIEPDQMAEMRPIQYTARDGLVIHGYLTLPRGRAAKQLPLVVNPHGGPYSIRDTWHFNPEVQFLANRGFAVLQMNYRGSGGYGLEFQQSGYQKWGLEMQNDITDGVHWAVREGIADPQRVVIDGASYGGYAAMAGLVFTPELYCAGINYVGVVDLPLHWNYTTYISPQERFLFNRWFGNAESLAVLRRWHDTSPVNFADRIRVPVLMAYGKNDPRVRIDQCYAIEGALKKAGREFELLIEKDEGHGFHKEEKNIEWYTRVDAFLKAKVLAAPKGKVLVGEPRVLEMPAAEGKQP